MTGRPPKQRTDYPLDLVRSHEARLSKPHFAILTAAAATGGGVEAIAGALTLASLGTVKSRLHRARKALAAVIKQDERAEQRHPNGNPKWSPTGMLLDENGNRSIFDDVDA